jgi:hypothetical protein
MPPSLVSVRVFGMGIGMAVGYKGGNVELTWVIGSRLLAMLSRRSPAGPT